MIQQADAQGVAGLEKAFVKLSRFLVTSANTCPEFYVWHGSFQLFDQVVSKTEHKIFAVFCQNQPKRYHDTPVFCKSITFAVPLV